MNDVAWIEARTLGTEAARETFALAARHVLADVAGEYHATITVAELAQAVQERTRIRNRQAQGLWIGDICYRVAVDCRRRNEPLLGALCVGPDGRMNDWYADTVLTVRGDTVTDPEQHAAEERLDCYRVHGADLPEGGGVPGFPTPVVPAAKPRRASSARSRSSASRPAAPRTRKAAAPAPAKPQPPVAKTCPSCFMQLPATGLCDNCD